jgi:preprotein translocase subunit SecD
MTRRNLIVLAILVAIFGFCLWALIPLQTPEGENPSKKLGRTGLQFGLDLVGGVHLVYETDFSDNTTDEERNAAMDRALTIIQKRIDKYGVTEPVIQSQGTERIIVQLPGFTDIEAAKSLVEQTGFLEFREVELDNTGVPVYLSDYLDMETLQFIDQAETADRIFIQETSGTEGTNYETVGYLTQGEAGLSFLNASKEPIDKASLEDYTSSISWIPARGNDGTPLTGNLLSDAQAAIDNSGVVPQYVISIEWNSEGTTIFDEVANRIYNSGPEGSVQRQLGILIDDSMLSAPQILRSSYGGSAQIEGSFTPERASELANLLKSGALPMPLKKPPLYQERVSATLGKDFISMSWTAGIIGVALVMLFIILYYRLPGFMASLALVFYGVLVLMLFKLIPVTLSLAGLGGFILSIGMAVDANVLIFERTKEELRTGRTLSAAVEVGFNRAWSGIRDSNITTIIVCVILYWLGSSIVASAPVTGFALTLGLGVLISMLTAIIVTRTFLRIAVSSPLSRRTALFRIDRGQKQ